jgi:glycosyltransferase involved in cell wall biosynthesis
MSSLRVGFALLRFFAEPTGNVESLRNLMTGLTELGCSTTLLTPRATPQLELFADFAVERYSERALSDFNIFAVERALVRACAALRGRFDLLQLQLPSPAFARIADRVRRASGLPVIASFESGFHRAPAVGWPAPGKTLLNLMLRRLLNDRLHARLTHFAFDGCVVASEYQRRELEAVRCSAPIHVVPNSTVCDRFAGRAAATPAEAALLPPGQRVIAYVGHFNFIKGVTHLIAAFERLARRRDDVHLLLVGSGRGNESRAVRQGVAALGQRASLVERTIDVAALLPRLDVLALPYVASFGHQLFPNLMLEGLASGVPLVSSDIPPVNEVIRDGDLGYLAKAGDADALAAALERALVPGEGREQMARRQRALCRERFDYRVVARRHLAMYEGALHA